MSKMWHGFDDERRRKIREKLKQNGSKNKPIIWLIG